MIQRGVRPQTNFTIMNNAVLQDRRLSYRARGVLASILSRPDNWQTTSEQLADDGKEGRDAVRTALSELEALGYLNRERTQDPVTGFWSTNMVVYDEPRNASQPDLLSVDDEPMTGSQASDNQASGNRTSDSQALKDKELLERTNTPSDLDPRAAEKEARRTRSAALFNEFWTAYPRHVAKQLARRKWDTLVLTKGVDPVAIINGARLYARACKDSEPRFIAHPSTWLNSGRYEDEVEEEDRSEPEFVGTEQRRPEWV